MMRSVTLQYRTTLGAESVNDPNQCHDKHGNDRSDQNVYSVRRDWKAQTVQADGAKDVEVEDADKLKEAGERFRELDIQSPRYRRRKLASGNDNLDGAKVSRGL